MLFLIGLREHVERLVLLGRLDPVSAPWHFPLPDDVEYEPLPHYTSLVRPWSVLRALVGSAVCFWRVLADVDAVWLFGPNPLAVVFAALAALRRRTVVLGVRQDYVSYVETRHPRRTLLGLAARVLDRAFRVIARRSAVLVVGPKLLESYARAGRAGTMTVALASEADVLSAEDVAPREPERPFSVLSVGRLDNEKNPLLLADAIALLATDVPGFVLRVAGEGPLEQPLRERLEALGVSSRVSLLGFVPAGAALRDVYGESDIFLHTSLTEGVPQVLFEAFAAALPVVATDVGSVAQTADGAALLVPPEDPGAVAQALRRLAEEPELRAHLARAGTEIARRNTLERRCREVAEFLRAAHEAGAPESAS